MKELAERNIEMIDNRVHLIADDDMVCTNGKDVYGSDITLAEGLTYEGFYMIAREEYEALTTVEEPEIV